jgi:hypothetical protein
MPSLVAEGHGQRVLEMCAPRHDGTPVLFREPRKRRLDCRQVVVDQGERIAHLQHGRRVHDVLSGGAPVHVAARFAALLGELMDDTHNRIADKIGLGLQLRHIEAGCVSFLADRLSGVLWDQADARLGSGQRHFDCYVARDGTLVREYLAHGRRAEHVAKDGGVEDSGGHGTA